MENEKKYPIPPEAQALLKQLLQERDGAQQRLDVAVLAMKATLGVPVDWTIRNIEEGFVAGENDGEHPRISSNQ